MFELEAVGLVATIAGESTGNRPLLNNSYKRVRLTTRWVAQCVETCVQDRRTCPPTAVVNVVRQTEDPDSRGLSRKAKFTAVS